MNKENFIANYPYQKQFKFPVTKIENNNVYSFNEDIIGEYPLALILDDEHINTFLCTPENLKELVVGYLKNKGYTVLTLGVEPEEIRNKEIYKHYGFVEHIKNAKEVYPDGTEIDVEYYGKKLK